MPDFTVAALSGEIAKKGFEIIFTEIMKKVFSKNEERKTKAVQPKHFKDHRLRTFERCTKIKTLLSRDEPVDMLQQYVNIKFSTKKGSSTNTFDDYDAIQKLIEKRRATIVGTAGSGKTVFMRYLWISMFLSTDTRIPIFLELRRPNGITTPNIITYIFHSILHPTKRLI
jgi:protein involved in ribonucleotide reduction